MRPHPGRFVRPLFVLLETYALAVGVWSAHWRMRGDANGWWALANAWAFWLLASGSVAGLASFARRNRWLVLAWTGLMAALGARLDGWWAPRGSGRERPAAGSERSFSLLTFNMLNVPRDLAPVLDHLRAQRADCLVLQECIAGHAAQMEPALAPLYPHRFWWPDPVHNMGFGVVSRSPFAVTGLWSDPGFEPFALRITLPVAPRPGDARPTDRSGPAPTLDLYCIHFIAPTNEIRRLGPSAILRMREHQVRLVLAEIERRGSPAIVAGDWNSTEASDVYRLATARLRDSWREAGRGPGWTWPRYLPFVGAVPMPPLLRLDYIFYRGRSLRVHEVRVLDTPLGSDHCPLLARLSSSQLPVVSKQQRPAIVGSARGDQ